MSGSRPWFLLACLAWADASGAFENRRAVFTSLAPLPGDSVSRPTSVSDSDPVVVAGSSDAGAGRQAVIWIGRAGAVAVGELRTPERNLDSIAEFVSADGTRVVGTGYFSGGPWREIFTWTPETGTRPTGLGGESWALSSDFTPDGSAIVGSVGFPGEGIPFGEAFRWSGSGGILRLGFLGGVRPLSSAAAVSADGRVIVGSSTAFLPERPGVTAIGPFRWTEESGMLGLGGLTSGGAGFAHFVSDDGSVVVGSAPLSDEPGCCAFRWTESEGMRALRGPGTRIMQRAQGISADGSAVVGLGTSGTAGELRLMRWTQADGIELLDDASPPRVTWVNAISADGQIAVGSSTAGPFVWDAERGMRTLRERIERELGLALPGWRLDHAAAMSSDGRRIVGSGAGPEAEVAAWLLEIAPDADGDGVPDADDTCPGTASGTAVDPRTGCSPDQLCPCPPGPRRGKHRVCLIRALRDLTRTGVVSRPEARDLLRELSASCRQPAARAKAASSRGMSGPAGM